MSKLSIPLSKPEITAQDVAAVNAALKSGKLTQGPQVEALEQMVAGYVGARFAIATNSHATALHTAMLAAGVTAGDEVVTSAFSFIATANCIEQCGAKPVFVDLDPISLNMEPGKVTGALTERSKAILTVHAFGLPAESARLCGEAETYGLSVLEDASQALGASANGVKIGGDPRCLAAVFSFYPGCPITTGEGGMITTHDESFAHMCRSLVNLGRGAAAPMGGGKGAGWLEHVRLGFNYRMSELSAALGVSQLTRIDETLAKRQRVADGYRGRLRALRAKLILPMEISGFQRSWSTFNLICREGVPRERIIATLAERGIATERYFDPPLHLQPFYREKYGLNRGLLPLCEGVANQIFAVPFFTEMTSSEVDYVCDAIEQCLA